MNNDISTRPAYLDQLAPPDAFADIIGFVTPPRISMRDDRFNPLDENGVAALPASLALQIILLWENDTRIYYPAGEYDPDSPTPPACYSDNKIAPSDGVLQPQHETCAGCPRSVRDQPSFKGTTLVSACKERYKIACLVAGAKGKVFLLDIGPASRKAYANYRNFLKQHHAVPNQVITTLGYADKAFQFSFQGWVNPQTAEMVKRIAETDEPAMMVGAFNKPRLVALPPQPKPPVTAQVTFDDTPAPVQEANVQDPPKRRGRPPKSETVVGPGPIPAAAFAAPSTPPQPAPAPKTNFGMEQGQKPPVDIQEALNRAFGP